MKCNICGEDIKPEENGWKRGHNARPVNKGRCCYDCNFKVVLPIRIKRVYGGKK